jgi:hypothetical protein
MRSTLTAVSITLAALTACADAATAPPMAEGGALLDKGGVPHEKAPPRIRVKGFIRQDFLFALPEHDYQGGRFELQIHGLDEGSLFSSTCDICQVRDVLQPGGIIGGSFLGEGPARFGKSSWGLLYYQGVISVTAEPVTVVGPGELRTPVVLSARIAGFTEPPFTTVLPPELEVRLVAKGELVMQIVAAQGDPTLLFRTEAEFRFR